MDKTIAVIAVVLAIIAFVAFVAPQMGTTVLYITLIMQPAEYSITPIALAYDYTIPPKPYDPYKVIPVIRVDAKLTREFTAKDRQFEIINSTWDPFEGLLIDVNLQISMKLYGSNGSLLLERTLTLDGGMQRTFKIYNSDFENLQPLKLVLDIYISLTFKGELIYERNWHLEKDGITIQ